MRGIFYTKPPTYIGGRQPYAPALGGVQSGPTPDSPPIRSWAQINAIIGTHAPQYFAMPKGARIAPQLAGTTPDAPPPLNRSAWGIISAHWQVDQLTVIYLTSVAPFLSNSVTPDNPPVRNRTHFYNILQSWQPPERRLPPRVQVAPLLPAAVTPDNPPVISYAIRNLILAQWRAPYIPIPELQVSDLVAGGAPDTTPDSYSFTDQTGVATATLITSNAVTITGLNAGAVITVSGGTYDINGSGSFTSSPGVVNNGDTIRAQHTSSASYNTAVNTVVTIGGVSDTFTSTTRTAPAGGGSGTHQRHSGGIRVLS